MSEINEMLHYHLEVVAFQEAPDWRFFLLLTAQILDIHVILNYYQYFRL